jgi:hypothetical protein
VSGTLRKKQYLKDKLRFSRASFVSGRLISVTDAGRLSKLDLRIGKWPRESYPGG